MRAEGRQLFRTHLASCILKKNLKAGHLRTFSLGRGAGGWMAEFLARRPTTKKN